MPVMSGGIVRIVNELDEISTFLGSYCFQFFQGGCGSTKSSKNISSATLAPALFVLFISSLKRSEADKYGALLCK